jgi:hypothetical protein
LNLFILIPDEALDILDNEASEDEAARKDFFLSRPCSHEANGELIEKANRYRNILEEASKSDDLIRQKWDEWEESIAELTLDEVSGLFLQPYWILIRQCRRHLKRLYRQARSIHWLLFRVNKRGRMLKSYERSSRNWTPSIVTVISWCTERNRVLLPMIFDLEF